ncbi:MAG: hypothetical protein EOP83_05100 [Verrucomicrobiaceae bacterium]|nr:MAG: hypothetical protein EOP83_05100 [Verrucomicrobiaceae bacterium]
MEPGRTMIVTTSSDPSETSYVVSTEMPTRHYPFVLPVKVPQPEMAKALPPQVRWLRDNFGPERTRLADGHMVRNRACTRDDTALWDIVYRVQSCDHAVVFQRACDAAAYRLRWH